MSELLFEIGVEDLPARFVEVGRQFLQQQMPKQLAALRVQHGSVQTHATPRRLVVTVQDLATQQHDRQELILGPAVSIAYHSAAATGDASTQADADRHNSNSQAARTLSKAGEGFLRKAGAQQHEIITQHAAKGPVIAVRKLHKGAATSHVLPQALQELIRQIPFAKTMRWESTEARFARPVRWIVCLLDNKVLPMQFADVHSSNVTYAHRFLSPQQATIHSTQDYLTTMEQGFVMLSTQQRKASIVQQCQQLAQQAGGKLLDDKELLDTVSQLVEWPWVVLGRFDPTFLQMPHEILLCEMNQHQKCFAVVDDRGKLLPYFLVVCGSKPADTQQAATGNEKVMAARFADGAFYYEKDCQSTLQQHSQRLAQQVFARNLGTMQDKMQRIVALSQWLCDQLQLTAKQCQHVARTAQLCKADLTTGVVGEFPKLQGVMGSLYAQRDNEDPAVVQGIAQHDWPRFAGDTLPQNEIAAVVGMADRLDTLVGILSKTKTVSGSNDPFGLRRCAIAVARIVLAWEFRFDLQAALQQAAHHYGQLLQSPSDSVVQRAGQFMQDRAAAAWSDKHNVMQPPLLQAVFAVSGSDLLDAWARAHVLQRWRNDDTAAFDQVTATFKRVSNLLSHPDAHNRPQQAAPNPPQPHSGQPGSTTAAENNLLQQTQQLQQWLAQQSPHTLTKDQLVGHYEQLLHKVVQIKPAVDHLFDTVMVLDKDPRVRQARVALLQRVQQPLLQLADFHRLASFI